jgi:hypothetical protein
MEGWFLIVGISVALGLVLIHTIYFLKRGR